MLIIKLKTILTWCLGALFFLSCWHRTETVDSTLILGEAIDTIVADQPTVNRLYHLGLVWGFLKYHHPTIVAGNVDWDRSLFEVLPLYLNMQTASQRDSLLLAWIKKLGDYDKVVTKTEEVEVKMETDLEWIDQSGFSEKLAQELWKIRYAVREPDGYYAAITPRIGNATFDNERPYSEQLYPPIAIRLLSLYRYWNIIQYYYPYRYLISEDWKQVLEEFMPQFLKAENELAYRLSVLSLIARIQDTHAEIMKPDPVLARYWGTRHPALGVSFIEDKWIVSHFLNEKLVVQTGLKIGDELLTINGKSVEDVASKISKLISASNSAASIREITPRLLLTNCDSIRLSVLRNDVEVDNVVATYDRLMPGYSLFFNPPKEGFRLIRPDIGYLYLGAIGMAGLENALSDIRDTKGLIIDLRCYPSEFVTFKFGKYLLPEATPFLRFAKVSSSNPGQFILRNPTSVGEKNLYYYKGKVVILVNEVTQSQAEFTAMAFRTSPRATIIGSMTAGADGDVSELVLPGGLYTRISGIGVYYPDGRETQLVGIVPDIEAAPTIAGIKAGRDEVLEKAVQFINER